MPARRTSRTSFLLAATSVPDAPLIQDPTDKAEESTVISWLLYITREARGRRRLLAAKLLVNLYSLQFVKAERGLSFASLLVPLLTRMLDVDPLRSEGTPQYGESYLCTGMHYAHAAPAVLATLVMDNQHMQKVAVEGKAITHLAIGLKSTFDGPASRKVMPWRPHPADKVETQVTSNGTCTGLGGPTWTCREEMDYREGCLKALAAIAPFEDAYRLQICSEGVLPHIIQALEPYQPQMNGDGEIKTSSGSSSTVVLAACAAVTALGRSVTALRTKLIEAEVAKPILGLMHSLNPELRIAATKALSNLVMNFSAVKESINEIMVVKKLCEQAHSANARLRLESLWALKQLVFNASTSLKLEVVNELGCSWIKLLIKTDPVDIPEGEVIGLVEKDYPPIAACRGPADRAHDVIMAEVSDSDVGSVELVAEVPTDASPDQHGEFDTRHTVKDDTEVQAQLLDLLRNLFCGDNASELVRYVLDEMGQDDFFRIILDRLKPRTLPGPTRKENFTTPPPSLIVGKVLFVLVHIAACDSKWRNSIASQHVLLKQILTFCNDPDREIRATCCWIAINLTYEDDASDRSACRERASELNKVGFFSHLRRMENDPELDVRERATAALHLLANLKITP